MPRKKKQPAKMTGTSPRPWVKLWREEKGAFAQLPFFARSLDAQLKKFADAHGVIDTGARPHADAIAFRAGADRGDRRLLRKFLPMLEEAGAIRLEPGRIVLLRWGEEQAPAVVPDTSEESEESAPDDNDEGTNETRPDHDAAANETRPSNDATTTEQRRDNDATTTEQRPCNESGRNPPKSRGRDRQEKEGEKEGEKDSPSPTPPASSLHDPRTPDDVMAWESALARSSRQAFTAIVEANGGIYQRQDRPEHLEVGRTAIQVAERDGVHIDDLLADWARDWMELAQIRTAKSWGSYVAARASGKPWKPGNGKSRSAGIVAIRARPEDVPEDGFGDDDLPDDQQKQRGVRYG